MRSISPLPPTFTVKGYNPQTAAILLEEEQKRFPNLRISSSQSVEAAEFTFLVSVAARHYCKELNLVKVGAAAVEVPFYMFCHRGDGSLFPTYLYLKGKSPNKRARLMEIYDAQHICVARLTAGDFEELSRLVPFL